MHFKISMLSLALSIGIYTNTNAQYSLEEAVYSKSIIGAYQQSNYPKVIALAKHVVKEDVILESDVAKAIISSYLMLADINNPKDEYLNKAKALTAQQVLLSMKRTGTSGIMQQKKGTTNTSKEGLDILSTQTDQPKTKKIEKIKSEDEEDEDDFDINDEDDDFSADEEEVKQSNIEPSEVEEEPETITLDNKSWIELAQLNIFSEGYIHDLWTKTPVYQSGINFAKRGNLEKAKEALEQATSYNNAYAMLKLGEVSESLNTKYKDEPEVSFDPGAWYEMAVENHLSAGVIASITYESKQPGWDEKDLISHNKIISEAASFFEPKAYYWLGNMASNKKNASKADLEQAYNHYLFAAKYKVQEAIEKLILMHVTGKGTVQSEKEASYWLSKLREIPNISNALIVEYENKIKTMP